MQLLCTQAPLTFTSRAIVQALMDVDITIKTEVLIAFRTGNMGIGFASCINFGSENLVTRINASHLVIQVYKYVKGYTSMHICALSITSKTEETQRGSL